MEKLSDIRLKDLQIFREVSRTSSIRETARRFKVTSGQISKYIRSLEIRMGVRLFKRSPTGMLMTEAGTELVRAVEEILAGGQMMEQILAGQRKNANRTLAIAGTAFLTTYFTTPTVCKMKTEMKGVTFRFLDLPPDQLVSAGLRSAFELAVHYGKVSWPATWVTEHIGRTPWYLCARSHHALIGRSQPLAQILEHAFVIPTYWTAEGLVRGDDNFPVSLAKRKLGFETATADAAIPILLATEQIAFLPSILIAPYVRQGKLSLVESRDVTVIEKDLYLSARSDAVPARLFDELLRGMRERLGGELKNLAKPSRKSRRDLA